MSWAQPANDLPCNATNVGLLTVGTPVVLTNQTNVNATTTTEFSTKASLAMGYNANYHLVDVWYKFVLPAGYKSAKVTLTTTSGKKFTMIQRDKYTCSDYVDIQNAIAPVGGDYLSTESFASSANQSVTSVRTYNSCQYASFANGDTVYLSVGGTGNAQKGNFDLSFEVYGLLGGGCPTTPAAYTCGSVDFSLSTAGPFTCTDPIVNLSANNPPNSLIADQWIYPGFIAKVWPIAANWGAQTLDFLDNGSVGINQANPTGPDTLVLSVDHVQPGNYSFRLNGIGAAQFGYEIINAADGTIAESGIFTSSLTTTNVYSPIGTANYTGPGVSNNPNSGGDGFFNPSVAGAGTHNIVYTWNNGAGCSGTKTIQVVVTCSTTPPTYTCGTVDFSLSTAGPFTCTDPVVDLSANNPPDFLVADQWIYPGFIAKVWPIAANWGAQTFDFLDNGAVGINQANPSGPDTLVLVIDHVQPGNYSFRLNGIGAGQFGYQIVNAADGTIAESGIFTSSLTTTNVYTPIGTANYTGPGVSNNPNSGGDGFFDPSVAGAGTHNIVYSWDNGAGCSGSKTIQVVVTCPTPACGTVGFNWQTGTAPTSQNLSCSNNTNYGLKANNVLTAGEYIAPGFTIGNAGGAITYSAIELEEGAGTGFVNIPGQQKVITYCSPSFQYSIRLTGSGSGNVVITDHATGTALRTVAFVSGMTIVLNPNTILGTATFSGPGVSNYKLGSSTFTGSGYGVFNPSLAGPGTHTLTYAWNNGIGCSGTNTISVTVSGTTPPNASNAQVCSGNTSTLTATGGSSYNWYDAATGGNLVGSQASFTTPALTVPTSYWVTSGTGTCQSSRVRVDVGIIARVQPTFTSIPNQCLGAIAPSLPGSSTNSIAGSWNPSVISTTTVGSATYTFTPSSGQCATTAQLSVQITDKVKPVFTALGPLCQKSTAPIFNNTSNNGVIGVWNPTPISTNNVGNVTYNFVPNAGQCASDTSMVISTVARPVLNITTDAADGNPTVVANFVNTSTNATTYDWDFGNGTSSNSSGNVSATYSNIGTYTITLTASNGVCPDTTWTKTINVIPYLPMDVHIPNVFSPNGDGANDEYFINVLNGAAFEAVIINRWGEEMISLSQLNEKWDGKTKSGDAAGDGVYYIKYKIRGLNGEVREGQTFFHLTM